MGDRANVYVKNPYTPNDGVYLYSHWGGTDLPGTVQKALQKEWRWDDHAYLTRIIFDAMTDGSRDMETGFGIATEPCDGQERIVEIDVKDQTVVIGKRQWSFSDYCKLESVGWGGE